MSGEEKLKPLAISRSKNSRLLEVIDNKLFAVNREDRPIDYLANAGTKYLRIEEIPSDEIEIADCELLIPVAHFQKEVFSTFGVPFLLKIKHREPFLKVKERTQKKLEVPDKAFELYKFAVIVMGEQKAITDDDLIILPDFLPNYSIDNPVPPRPWLGLEHINKLRNTPHMTEHTPKRPRYNMGKIF